MVAVIEGFREYSERIVRDFLQTIVVVDDRAYFDKPDVAVAPKHLTPPSRQSFRAGPKPAATKPATGNLEASEDTSTVMVPPASTGASHEITVERANTPQESSGDVAHLLDAKSLILNFASAGMNCAVLRPSELEVKQLPEMVIPLAERSDIVMLDWVLYQEQEGRIITEIITELTKTSSLQERRLRLIVIYTGELDLSNIAERIIKALNASGINDVKKEGEYTIIRGAVRIVLFAKNNTRDGVERITDRIVPVDDLPNRLIKEFADMTIGLVSNVALQSLAALRLNTHRILSKFHAGMDAPFLSHRAMLPQPEDAKDLLMYLIGQELLAVLDGYDVGSIADERDGFDVIKAWLEKKIADGYKPAERFAIPNNERTIDILHKFLREGVEKAQLPNHSKNRVHKDNITTKLADDQALGEKLEAEFAVLTSIKSDYRSRPVPLLPGTILKEVAQGAAPQPKYWLCIQPICDCVRIKEARFFPFLHLVPAQNEKSFDLVLPDGEGVYVKVKVSLRPYHSRLIAFDPSDDGSRMVRSEVKGNEKIFTGKDSIQFKHIADLKFEHAQRIINKYAAELSRVGLDESEWLRRWSEER